MLAIPIMAIFLLEDSEPNGMTAIPIMAMCLDQDSETTSNDS